MKPNHFPLVILLISAGLFLLAFPPIAVAQDETSSIEEAEPAVDKDVFVNSIAFCEEIQDRVPVKPGDEFSHEIERVYCHTDINCRLEEANIQHLWYLNEKLVSTIDLKIGKARNWRTWSYKTMYPEAVGKWEVVVKIVDGEVLKMGQFTVK